MVRCFSASVAQRRGTESTHADFMSSKTGSVPWLTHWFCYGFASTSKRCALDEMIRILRSPAKLLVPVQRDVSPSFWSAYNSAEPATQRFYRALYTLYNQWSYSQFKPPPKQSTEMDDKLLDSLSTCDSIYQSFRDFREPEIGLDLIAWMHSRKPVNYGALRMLITENLFSNPIARKVVSAQDPFVQMMLGVACLFRATRSKIEEMLEAQQFAISAAFELFSHRYRGPYGESVYDGPFFDSNALDYCVKNGYLTPEYLHWITKYAEDCDTSKIRRHVIDVLYTTANLFRRWAELHSQ
eukprot:Blabericola_migrator_1__2389@NODE_1670_length_4045_cov_117_102061_g1084_i0_p2_GENE_NODE_1670_length_4045_cov_117_102061_g1084_i0NODE_1670_length_4045_cov_117_102061_g1084_i0_p2_ORF_typecomplete_len297_score18_58RdRP_4/PF02123_16/0_079_NODE_1670_length_4045_cov_117_102061_g1084_i015432433